MASALTHAHILGEQRLRRLVGDRVTQIWHSLPGYDKANLDQWLSQVLPLIDAGQRQSANLTDAYIARVLGRQPLGIDPGKVTGGAVRNGTSPETVYTRPFVTLWGKLGQSTPFAGASSAALARAVGTSAMDMQLAMRGTLGQVGEADSAIAGFQRVADGDACEFCQEVDGAQFRTEDPMPLHNNCGCSVEPVEYTRGQSLQPTPTPDTVAVHDHGELGPVLADPTQNFTSESQI